ncbi:MAG: glycosyltransferase family 9 protein, partial [Bacteroidales bacterium]|nr:glycosyltransferase family 9 protein [Bacteroidales bacterium]
MANVLILRFSAIGDVAMTVPVIDSLARQRSGNSYTVVSQDFLKPLFDGCPDNVRFIGINLKTDYRGIAGMFRLYGHLSQFRFDMVADLHDVLRTKLLRFLFRCSGLKVRHIRKGRKEKRRLTARRNKQFRPLKSSTERYADVFRALGLPAEVRFRSVFASGKGDFSRIEAFTGVKSGKWTGIAPFAKHQGKIYPIDRTERIIAHFSQKGDTTLFLFGGGSREKEILEKWSVLYPHTVSVAGKLKMSEELILISHLDVMLSMDSANMHLASLTATPVVSVWGATHPHAGFYGYRQLPQNAVQLSLSCRPCSVYGNKPCYRKDVACLTE